jgi:hypothetical protein
MARLGRRAGAFAAEELSWDRYMGAINGMLASCSDRFGSRADAARAAEPEHAGS